jgi:hypothetical protein
LSRLFDHHERAASAGAVADEVDDLVAALVEDEDGAQVGLEDAAGATATKRPNLGQRVVGHDETSRGPDEVRMQVRMLRTPLKACAQRDTP